MGELFTQSSCGLIRVYFGQIKTLLSSSSISLQVVFATCDKHLERLRDCACVVGASHSVGSLDLRRRGDPVSHWELFTSRKLRRECECAVPKSPKLTKKTNASAESSKIML